MANAPWARLTNPIRPIVTESPTETTNSTVPAAKPPNRMLTKLANKSPGNLRTAAKGEQRMASGEYRRHSIRYSRLRHSPPWQWEAISDRQEDRVRRSLLRRTRADRKLLALVLHLIDLADHL